MKAFVKAYGLESLYKFFSSRLDWRWCSGDLTDSDGEQAITSFVWRSAALRAFFRRLDLLGLVLRFPDGVHASSGQFPTPRYDPTENGLERILEPHRGGVVKGLPLNCYDTDWYNALDDEDKLDLDPMSDVPLDLPKKALQFVFSVLLPSETC